jgi:hypothetical protein
MSIISNENRQRPLDVDGRTSLTREAIDPRKLAEARFHAAAAARIAAREALDAALRAEGVAAREMHEAEERAADRKTEAGIEARKQLNLIREWLRNADHSDASALVMEYAKRIDLAIDRVEEHLR